MKAIKDTNIKPKHIAVIGLVLAVLSVGGYYGYKAYKKRQNSNITDEEILKDDVIDADINTMDKEEIRSLQEKINLMYERYPSHFSTADFSKLPIAVDGIKGSDTILGQQLLQVQEQKVELAGGFDTTSDDEITYTSNTEDDYRETNNDYGLGSILGTWF